MTGKTTQVSKEVTPSISVAIATYNSGDLVFEMLDSIMAQTVRPLEVVCSDDGSSDGTPDRIERYAETAPIPVRVIRLEHNGGIIGNFLSAFRATKGDAVAYCDHDDVWLPGKIAAATEALRDPDVHLVCQPSILTDGDLNETGEVYYAQDQDVLHGFPVVSARLHAWGHQMVFSRKALDRLLALYDLDVFATSEYGLCFDFGIPLAASLEGGVHLLAAPQTKFRRHEGATTDCGFTPDISQSGLRARIDNRVKHIDAQMEMLTQAENILAALDQTDQKTSAIREATLQFQNLLKARRGVAEPSSIVPRFARLARALHLGLHYRDAKGRKDLVADVATAVYGKSV